MHSKLLMEKMGIASLIQSELVKGKNVLYVLLKLIRVILGQELKVYETEL